MDRRTRLYILSLASVAILFVALNVIGYDFSELDRDAWQDVLAFAALGILSQAAAINFDRGGSASSMAFIPFLASTVLLPPLGTIVVGATTAAVDTFILRRRGFFRGAHNVAQTILAMGFAAHVYTQLSGSPTRLEVDPWAFFPTVIVLFGTNIILSSFALSLFRGQSFQATLLEVAGPRGGNLVYDLFASWIVLLAVRLYLAYTFWGILAMIVCLLVIRHIYFSRRKLEEANDDLLTVLVTAIETRDPYTSGHSMRVSTLSALIAEDLKLSRRRVDLVRRAALLHDIGKIDPIYSDVLRKPHHLTPEERELIQTHAARGADLLRDLSSVDSDIIAAVRHHHERYDGDGYPDQIAGDDIPLMARIIMMSDSIDAMLSDRPYRTALTLDQVVDELAKNKGTQFDPRIVRTVLAANTLQKAATLVTEWQDKVENAKTFPSGFHRPAFPLTVKPALRRDEPRTVRSATPASA